MRYLRVFAVPQDIPKTIDFAWFLDSVLVPFGAYMPMVVVSEDERKLAELNSASKGKYYACTQEEEAMICSPSLNRSRRRAEIKVGSQIVMKEKTDCLVVHNRPENQVEEVVAQAIEAEMRIIWAQELGDAQLAKELILARKEALLKERQVVIITFASFIFKKVALNMSFLRDEEGEARVMQGEGGSPDEEFGVFRVNKARDPFELSKVEDYIRDAFPGVMFEERVVDITSPPSPSPSPPSPSPSPSPSSSSPPSSSPPSSSPSPSSPSPSLPFSSLLSSPKKRKSKVKSRRRQVRAPL